ncbi:MAG: SMC family ATPase [Deltaproteobacteria bacterium]|nr:SMC family ATPase [Deltaproteobacteria bacterium]
MILRRLSLRNFRKYRSCELEFPQGLIGVVGRNGMGKTTLLEAVAFALYGANASRTRAKGVRRDGCEADAACEVELEFELEGRPCRVLRRARGSGEMWQAELWDGGGADPAATGPRDVDAAVQQRLAMDYTTFTRSVFSKQKEVAALSDAQPEERRAAIRRMVGIETISKARALAAGELRDKEKELEGARRNIEALPERAAEAERVRAEIRLAASAARKAVGEARAAARRLKAATSTLAVLERKQRADADLDKRFSRTDAELVAARNNAERLEGELAALGTKKAESAALAGEAKAFGAVRKEKERLDRASGRHEERVALERDLERAKRQADETARQCESLAGAPGGTRQAARRQKAAGAEQRAAAEDARRLHRTLADARERRGSAVSARERLDRAIADIRAQGASGTCPTCHRELGGTYEEILEHLARERNGLHEACSTADAEVGRIEELLRRAAERSARADRSVADAAEEVRRAAEQTSRMAGAREKGTAARGELRRLGKRLAALRRVDYDAVRHETARRESERLEKVHRKVELLRKEVAREPGLRRELHACRKKEEALARAAAATERRRRALGFDREAFQAARAAAEQARLADKSAALESGRAEAATARLRERLAQVLDDVERLEMLRVRIAEDEEQVRYLRRAGALLDGFRGELIGRVRPQIEEHASYLLDQVTAGRYPRVVLDDDYNIALDDGEGVFPLKRFSGGEEDLANLCLRIAIAQVVAQRAGGQSPSVVVLDEVFAAQDSDRREKLLQALGRLQEIFRQIILITHMEDIHDRVPHVLRITENAAREAEAAWM